MSKSNRKFLLPIFTSLVFAYAIYVYVLQTPTYLSRSRLLVALFVAAVLFLLFCWAETRFRIFKLLGKQTRWGVLSLFIFLNLFFVGFLSQIPYTYVLLPTQSVSIFPTSAISNQKPVRITSFDTELVNGVSLPNFTEYTGWQTKANTIVQDNKLSGPLTWIGKPGEYIEIRLDGCDGCGDVEISWNDGESQMITRSMLADQNEVAVKQEFLSLWWHKLLNFLLLEISALIFALLVTNIGVLVFRKLESTTASPLRESRVFSSLSPTIGLGVLTLLSYGMKVQPVLFNDDWCHFYQLYMGGIPGFATAERRPLHRSIPWIFSQFLPYDQVIIVTYLAQILIIFLSAVFLYLLVHKMMNGRKWFAFLVAALYLVFPTDYTRLYITMIGIRPAFLLLLLAFLSLLNFLKINDKRKSTGWMFLSILLLVVSLLIYEGQTGLAFVLPVILIVVSRPKLPRLKLISLIGYYLTLIVFVYWKLVLQPKIYPDEKIDSILTVSPIEILHRYLYAVRTILGGFQFPYLDGSWLSIWNIMILSAVIIASLGLYFAGLRLFREQASAQSKENARCFYQEYLWIILIGAALWLVGYMPLILNYPPNIYGHMSRVNLFSIPGVVLILLAMITIFFRSVSASEVWMIRGISVTVILLVLFGVIIQLQTQEAYNQAWNNTKAFYMELFDQVPDLKEGTQVVFDLTGYEEYSGRLFRPVFSSSWEANCSLRVLYNKQHFDLGVVYRYQAIEVPPFPGLIVLPSTLETNTLRKVKTNNLSDWIILRYNHYRNEISVLEEPPSFLGEDLTGSYQPYERIIPLSKEPMYRNLVE